MAIQLTSADTVPSPAVRARGARPVLRELLALACLALLLPVDGRALRGRDGAVALTSALLLAFWIAIEPVLRDRALAFSPYALPAVALIALGVLGLAWLFVRLLRPAVTYRRVLLLTLGAMPAAMFASLASEKAVGLWFGVLIGAVTAYLLAYFSRGLRALTGRRQWPALIAGAIATVMFVVGLDQLRVNSSLWVRADENLAALDGAGAEWTRMAQVQFAQQARIDAEIARIATKATPAPEVFFVGFAGYGTQQVFAREIELAAKVVGARYDVGERSLLLVNDRRDLDRRPLASEPALRHALRRLGGVMGDEDVLFLALSSHGERDAALKVTNAGLVPSRLRAEALADMLRESGIAWKVVVVSACYSGSFVDALADPRTIVIAAAASDRKSFGCDDKRELTYFGEAFFRDALRDATSLRAAFEAARTELQAKETRGGITPSKPQAYFGEEILKRLDMGTVPHS